MTVYSPIPCMSPVTPEVRRFCLLVCLFLAFSCVRAEDAASEPDAVTAASVDATTGASKELEPVKVTDSFSVAYAINDDGSLFIAAADLADAYQRDELASDSLFKDKEMVVKGTLEKRSRPGTDKPWVSLSGGGESGKKVRCALKKGQLRENGADVGAVVQIRGVCKGMKLSVSIEEGEFLD